MLDRIICLLFSIFLPKHSKHTGSSSLLSYLLSLLLLSPQHTSGNINDLTMSASIVFSQLPSRRRSHQFITTIAATRSNIHPRQHWIDRDQSRQESQIWARNKRYIQTTNLIFKPRNRALALHALSGSVRHLFADHQQKRCATSAQNGADVELVSIIDHLDEIHKIPLADVRNFCIIAHVVSSLVHKCIR